MKKSYFFLSLLLFLQISAIFLTVNAYQSYVFLSTDILYGNFTNTVNPSTIESGNRLAQVNYESDIPSTTNLSVLYPTKYNILSFNITNVIDSERILTTYKNYTSNALSVKRDNAVSDSGSIINNFNNEFNLYDLKLNGIIGNNLSSYYIRYYNSTGMVIGIFINFVARTLQLYNYAGALLESKTSFTPLYNSYKFFHYALTFTTNNQLVFSCIEFNESSYISDNTTIFTTNYPNLICNQQQYRFTFGNLLQNTTVYALDSNFDMYIDKNTNYNATINPNFDFNSIERFYRTYSKIDYSTYLTNYNESLWSTVGMNNYTYPQYNYYKLLNYRSNPHLINTVSGLNYQTYKTYKYNHIFEIDTLLSSGNTFPILVFPSSEIEFTYLTNTFTFYFTNQLNGTYFKFDKDGVNVLTIYNPSYVSDTYLGQSYKFHLKQSYLNEIVQFDFILDSHVYTYSYIIGKSFLWNATFSGFQFMSNFKLYQNVNPISFVNSNWNLNQNITFTFNPIFEYVPVTQYTFSNQIYIPTIYPAESFLSTGGKTFYLNNTRISKMVIDIYRNYTGGGASITDLTNSYTLFINNTQNTTLTVLNNYAGQISNPLLPSNGGSLFVNTNLVAPAFSGAAINYTIVVIYQITYSDYTAPINLIFELANNLILPFSILAVFLIAFSISKSKIFPVIGLLVALFVFYWLELLSVIMLILLIAISGIIMYFLMKHEEKEGL